MNKKFIMEQVKLLHNNSTVINIKKDEQKYILSILTINIDNIYKYLKGLKRKEIISLLVPNKFNVL